MNSARQAHDYTREPNIGWDKINQISYSPISDMCAFSLIVVNADVMEDDMVEIIFQKPTNPVAFNSILSGLNCEVDETQKLLNHFEITIHILKIKEILSAIQQAGFLSDFVVNDICISVNDIQPSLKEHRKQEAEEQKAEEQKQKAREKILAENSFWIQQEKLQTQKLASIVDELFEDQSKKEPLEVLTTLSIEEKKRLPFFLTVKLNRFNNRLPPSTIDANTQQWALSKINKFKLIYQLLSNMNVPDNKGLGEAILNSEQKINVMPVEQDMNEKFRTFVFGRN